MAHLFYLIAAAALALVAPAETMSVSARLFVVVGAIGLWRYGWLLVNLLRALYYAAIDFPRLRRRAVAHARSFHYAPHAYFLVTSYRIGEHITRAVFRSLFETARNSPYGATIVASIVEQSDEELIKALYAEHCTGSEPVKLEIVRIAGTGKRDALAAGLRAIAEKAPAPRDIVVLLDGDSCLPPDLIQRSAPFLGFDRRIAALTTDEICMVEGGRLFRDWYELRFAQRQMMMCSMGLARRVLTLTGRMSMFTAEVATNPDFIESVQHDSISHWRLGTVKFLTGDDKSTWFWILRQGYHMLYLPDVRITSLESQPKPSFLASAKVLMVRWYGNTLRNNGRSLRLGPHRIGLFTWWSILDQRMSLWTTLTGPLGALIGTALVDPFILPLYLAWVMATRYAACLVLTLFRSPFRLTYPFLLYFSQIYGAVLKTYVFFYPDRQRWTRQNTALVAGDHWLDRLRALSSGYMRTLAGAFLLTLVATMMGLVNVSRV